MGSCFAKEVKIDTPKIDKLSTISEENRDIVIDINDEDIHTNMNEYDEIELDIVKFV